MLRLKKLFYAIVLILAMPFCSTAQNVGFAAGTIPLDSLENIAATSSLVRCRPLLLNKKVIGIGEATHGSREFVWIKSKFFLFLNRDLGANELLMEIPFSVAPYITDYINGESSFSFIDSLLKPAKTIHSKEFFAFLDTLREINAAKAATAKIRIWGIDVDQFYDYAVARLKKIAGNAGKSYQQQLDEITVVIPQNYKKVSRFSKEYRTPAIQEAINKIDSFFSSIQSKLGVDDIFIATNCIKQLRDSYEYWGAGNNSFANRDKLMADNIQLIQKYCSSETVMVWAHNLHIKKNAAGVKMMGELLAERYGQEYFAIGSVFKEGSFRVWYKGVLSQNKVDASGSGEFALFLDKAAPGNYFFATTQLQSFFNKNSVMVYDVGIMQAVAASKVTLHPFKDFDAYFYLDSISAFDL
ncbi:MAG: erythromycin esterase family protein [Chitinophagaceae bacterium]